jgi:fatty acid synthase, animal type
LERELSLYSLFTDDQSAEVIIFNLQNIFRLFQNGVDVNIANLYPQVSFPVSRGTPMISPIISWDHSQSYFVPYFDSCNFFERQNLSINISDKAYDFVKGHIIDGKVLFPGTGWLILVWETFSMMMGVPQNEMKVIFEEVKFIRATSMQKNQDISVTIAIHRASGHFEITEGKSAVAQGTIKAADNIEMSDVSSPESEDENMMQEADFYKELRLRGYHHQGLFRAVKEVRDDGLKGAIKWNNDWTTFTDCMIQFFVIMKDTRMLVLPTSVRKMVIDPRLHQKMLNQIDGEDKILTVESCPYQKIIRSGGVEIHEFGGSSVNRRRPQSEPVLEAHKFVAHNSSQVLSNIDVAKVCVQLALENEPVREFVCVEVDGNDDMSPFCEFIFSGLQDLPLITPKINLLTSKTVEIENINVQNVELSSIMNINLIVRSNYIEDKEFLDAAKTALNGKGFILSRTQDKVS